jgi:hypothetical protein
MTATLIRPLSAQTTPTLPRMSEQKFWRASGEGDRGEWVDGSVIVTSPVSIRHVLIVGFLNTVLGIYARRRGQGVVLGPEFALAGQCACLRDDLGDERRMRPQLINGGGRVDREYGLGRRRTDLCVVWNYPGGVQRGVIELKLLHNSLERTLAEGLEQTWRYADANAAEEAHLIIFDRTPDKPWSEKIWRRTEQFNGMTITVWGM